MKKLSPVVKNAVDMARDALDEGDLKTSEREVARAAAAAPEHPEVRLLQAELLTAQGRGEEAEASYRQLLADPIEDGEIAWLAHANFAELLVNRGAGREAIREAQAAIELDPSEADPYLAAARGYLTLGQPGNALNYLNDALHNDNEFVEALALRGKLLAQRRSYGDAMNDFSHAVDLAPKNSGLYIALARTAAEVGDLTLALKTVDEGLTRVATAEEPPLRELRARLLLQGGAREDGLAELERLVGSLPSPPVPLLLLRAETRLDGGDATGALADFDTILQREPQQAEALEGRLDTLLLLERYEEALDLIDELLAEKPTADRYHRQGELLYERGEIEEAQGAFTRALQLEPAHPHANYSLGLLLLNEDQLELATDYLDRAVELAPEDEERYRSRSEALRRLERPYLAWMDADRALEIDEDFIEAYLTRALASIAQDQFEDAFRDLEVALTLYPDFGEALATRARLLTLVQQEESARADWQRYLKLPDEEQDLDTLREARSALRG